MKKLVCPKCDGMGFYSDSWDEYSPSEARHCSVCNGKGKVSKKQLEKYKKECEALFKLSAWWP